MFFVMTDKTIDGKTYTIRCGRMTISFDEARRKAVIRKGYIVNESNKIIGQAFDPELPRYIGSLKNIGSGEDCFAGSI
jgi:hypothetical protein